MGAGQDLASDHFWTYVELYSMPERLKDQRQGVSSLSNSSEKENSRISWHSLRRVAGSKRGFHPGVIVDASVMGNSIFVQICVARV